MSIYVVLQQCCVKASYTYSAISSLAAKRSTVRGAVGVDRYNSAVQIEICSQGLHLVDNLCNNFEKVHKPNIWEL